MTKKSYAESSAGEDHSEDPVDMLNYPKLTRKSKRHVIYDEDNHDEAPRQIDPPRKKPDNLDGFIVSDGDGGRASRYATWNSTKKPLKTPPLKTQSGRTIRAPTQGLPIISQPQTKPRTRASRQRTAPREKSRPASQDDPECVLNESSAGSADAEGEPDDAVPTSDDEVVEPEPMANAEVEGEVEPESDGKPYPLRRRNPVDYAVPPPVEEMQAPPVRSKSGDGVGKKGHGGGRASGKAKGLGWSATGAELSRWMGLPGDDSDSDNPFTRMPRKPFSNPVGGLYGAGGSAMGGGLLPGDLAAAAGTPSNLGKIGDASLADIDPLGVNTNVTFDEVGGLDDHIHALKEMTLLPLLYPEVFQRFNVTPPRGVLFHGPPGTGKTLMARALAANCRTGDKGISFFMRKGADCLSKWVGEAERQLRLLFEEAKNCQPSIIFFDEIDGLAPVRSSKQDQIHASIVSTLLALMDGMDGRGQVIVIGATNRPDAVDPALRRPGRFDREFYFGLPGLEAREKILNILTRKWEGWSEPEGQERIKGLAELTKGYGGADLRALCTEAALNAIQRRYPQIYKSNDRLLLKPESINVGLRDFMISIKKLVPSSARSSTSAAAPLPTQLVPLLGDALEQLKRIINKVLPVGKKRTALEEAEYDDDADEASALQREMLMQSMETLRVYRPRVVFHGRKGMGQGSIGAAALHHLEGFHVQSLELGALFGDSVRTVEAAIVQLFVEAKRHQPSVIYIPSLIGWCAAVPETSRSIVRAMLDTLLPTDPILLLAVVDGRFSELPPDVCAWFGYDGDNYVEFQSVTDEQRERFFESLLQDVRKPPDAFTDGVPRKKRVLEELPIAPPLQPRQPTAAELAAQEESDQKIITLLKYRLGPILTELKRKFKRFTKRATEEYRFDLPAQPPVEAPSTLTTTVTTAVVAIQNATTGTMEVIGASSTTQQEANGDVQMDSVPTEQQQAQQMEALPPLFDMDLERMHVDLYKGKYLTPQDFLDDIHKIVHNTAARQHEDPDRLYKAQAMLTAAEVSIHDFDPHLKLECERMSGRERKRREERKKLKHQEKAKASEGSAPNGATFAPGPRRSARNNGQQPELGITDPLKLERRLKRQRADEASAEVVTSEGEHSDARTAKRSRVGSEEVNGVLSTVGEPPLRPMAVRFAIEDDDTQDPSAPAPSDPPQIDTLLGEREQMVTDHAPPQRSSGFDPSLLNPLPSSSAQPLPPWSSHFPNGVESVPSTSESTASQVADYDHPLSVDHVSPNTPPPASPLASLPVDQRPATPSQMLIERTPTPPHPEFFVDESKLSYLTNNLTYQTSGATVEQLEQLRAACLGAVWRHRTKWNRDALLDELQEILDSHAELASPVVPMSR